ncbi:MAG TPA: ribbon-helix-helix protein, CopG family [Rhodanobacteraceae bacterium]
MSITTVRLKPEVEQGLTVLADRQQRSKSWLINRALEDYLARQKCDDERWRQTIAAMDSVACGKVASASAVHDWLASWGATDELASPKVDG